MGLVPAPTDVASAPRRDKTRAFVRKRTKFSKFRGYRAHARTRAREAAVERPDPGAVGYGIAQIHAPN
jgi:hypothetical protein